MPLTTGSTCSQPTNALSRAAKCGSAESPPPTRSENPVSTFPRKRAGHGGKANVVDLGISAPDAAPGDRDLELARQIVEIRVAGQQPRDLHRQR